MLKQATTKHEIQTWNENKNDALKISLSLLMKFQYSIYIQNTMRIDIPGWYFTYHLSVRQQLKVMDYHL